MDWGELTARARAHYEAASARAKVRTAILVVVAIGVVVATIGFVAARSSTAASPPGAATASGSVEATGSAPSSPSVSSVASARPDVIVSVAGAVAKPGVVTLPFASRVVDAIDAAGGASHGADPNALDLAAKLADGMRVYVPKIGEHVSPMPAGASGDAAGADAAAGSGAPDSPVDLNTATEAQLEALPGIGPSLASAIMATRERLGGFRSVDELREVRGIGDRRFADLRPLVTV